jgi:hypothetical protein
MTAPNMPSWQQPASVGLLSNKRGSNTGADAITMKARYTNPRANADPALAIRVISQRTVTGGTPQNPTTSWDSGWVGGVTVNALPTAVHSHQTLYANGRIYVIGGQDSSNALHAEVWSAPFNNGSVGTWRQEVSYPYPVAGHAACAVAMNSAAPTTMSFIYVIGGAIATNPLTPGYCSVTSRGWYAPINADGSLGGWAELAVTLSFAGTDNPRLYGALCQIGWNTQPGAPFYGLPIIAFTGGTPTNSAAAGAGVSATTGATATLLTSTLKQDGSMWETFWQGNGGMTDAMYGHFMWYDAVGNWIMVVGGSNGTNATQDLQYGGWNPAAPQGTVTWAHNTTGLPAQRAGMAGIYVPSWDNSNLGRIILIGGANAAAVPSTTSQYSSGIFAAANTGITSGSWTTFTNALGASLSCLGAAGVMEARSGTIAGVHQIAVLGGKAAGGSSVTTVNTASATPPLTTAQYGTWRSGTGTALGAGSLGTGGAATTNQDGSIDFTWNYGGFGQTMLSSFADGDQAQISVQFLDQQAGDVSPAAYTLIKIGQAPTLSSITPANAATPSNGQPSLSFLYSAGAGGGNEYSYDIQVKQASTVVFDTGTRYDNANLVSPLTIAPLLAASTAYTLVITATSTDTAYPGSTVSVTSTTTFTTTAFTLPGTPGSFSATPSGANANVALSWSAATGSPSYYRVYHRRNGSSTWILLQDNVAGTSYTAMDHIALGVAYDYAVSAVTATPTEGALATATNVTIPLGAWSAYLHVAGAGATYGVPLQVDGSPSIANKLDATYYLGFGQAAPVARYGTADYHTLSMPALLLDSTPATLKAAQAVMGQAQAGGVCFYRDALGGMLVVTVDAEQGLTILPPWNRQLALKLTEVLDTVAPYVASGSAQGYLTLASGRRPPLDTSESIL